MSELTGHNGPICGIKFAAENDHTLLSAGADSVVALWDLRTGQPESTYEVPEGIVPTSFDVNCDDSLLCIGTELAGDDAHVILWDARQADAPVLAFSDAHSDDITQVFRQLLL